MFQNAVLISIYFYFCKDTHGAMKRGCCFAPRQASEMCFSLSLVQNQYSVSDAISLLQKVLFEG